MTFDTLAIATERERERGQRGIGRWISSDRAYNLFKGSLLFLVYLETTCMQIMGIPEGVLKSMTLRS